ncbi:MAG: hypothetical protein HY547_02380 [Elusimicrobia bacterium]|nr:hypothetical protein [Elusimicrobiota bacterium]
MNPIVSLAILLAPVACLHAGCPEGFETFDNGACSQVAGGVDKVCLDGDDPVCQDETSQLIRAASQAKESYLKLVRSINCVDYFGYGLGDAAQADLPHQARSVHIAMSLWARDTERMLAVLEDFANGGEVSLPYFARPEDGRRAFKDIQASYASLWALGLSHPDDLPAVALETLIYGLSNAEGGIAQGSGICAILDSQSLADIRSAINFLAQKNLTQELQDNARLHQKLEDLTILAAPEARQLLRAIMRQSR